MTVESNPTVPKPFTYHFKRNPLDRKRRLVITPEYLEFEDDELISNPYKKFEKAAIAALKYYIEPIVFELVIGHSYHIDVRNLAGEEMKIVFKSFFAYKNPPQHARFSEMVNLIWEYFFAEAANALLLKFSRSEEFELCGVRFNKTGVVVKKDGFIKSSGFEIPFEKLQIKNYQEYFVLFSSEEPSGTCVSFVYKDVWNALMLDLITKAIINDRQAVK